MSDAPTALLGLTNSEAEDAVLFAMRTDTSAAVEIAELLEPADFHDSRRAIVFEAIQLLLLGMEPIDTKAILSEARIIIQDRKLKSYIDEAYIEGLTGGDARRYAMYANTIKKLAWLRQAGDYAFWLVGELQGRPKPDVLFAAAQERWQTLAPKLTENRFVYGWDTLKEHSEIIRDRMITHVSGARIRYDWPWASWNHRVRPLQAGFVGIIAAADGMGKTTYLEEIAEYWASQGIHTIYVHLEDNREYKYDRRLARHAKVSIAHIQDGDLTEEEKERIGRAEEKLERFAGYLHYFDAAGDSMNTIVRELEARVAEGICQAVVYDYMDKTQPSRGQIQVYAGNTWERQANDMEQLKVFCTKHKIAALTATQGNKTMQGNGTQTRSAIQGSGQKSQKAQLVIIVTRELVGEAGMKDPDGNVIAEAGEYSPIAKVRIDKQNIGKTGEFRQYLVGKFFSVQDVQSEKPKTETKPMFGNVRTPYKDD